MAATDLPEVWLRGPLPNITPLLQPVAHALLQAKEEVTELMNDFPASALWNQPAGVASAGFHLQHLAGVLDRLFTYAKGASLSPEQLLALYAEGRKEEGCDVPMLVRAFQKQIEKAVGQLQVTDEKTLTEYRSVGRAGLPSTVLGLLVHAAEHTMRHVGQLLVTVRVLTSE